MYKLDFKIEQYLLLNIAKRIRKYLAQFRTVCLNFAVESGRWCGIALEDSVSSVLKGMLLQ